jgi:ABC-2 type transport system permease protein
MSVRAFVRLFVAQATMLRRDLTYWLTSISIAVLSMAVFGWLFQPGTQAFDLAVVDEDRTPASQSLVEAFAALENANVWEGSRGQQLEKLRDGDRGAVIVVPEGFGDRLDEGGASVLVYYDNSNPIQIGYVTSTVEAVVDHYNGQVTGRADAVRLERQAVETDSVRYIEFLTPGMVGMTIMWTNLIVGILLVTWREQGILRRLGVTPLKPGILIASQAASFALISLVQVTLILLMGRCLFDVAISGNFVWLGVSVLLGVLCMLSLGYVIGSVLGTPTSVNATANLLAFPMLFLGRSYFPLDPPPALAPVVNAIPLTYLNDALREVVNRGGGLGNLWLDWLVLAAWTSGGYLLSIRLFRWQ